MIYILMILINNQPTPLRQFNSLRAARDYMTNNTKSLPSFITFLSEEEYKRAQRNVAEDEALRAVRKDVMDDVWNTDYKEKETE